MMLPVNWARIVKDFGVACRLEPRVVSEVSVGDLALERHCQLLP